MTSSYRIWSHDVRSQGVRLRVKGISFFLLIVATIFATVWLAFSPLLLRWLPPFAEFVAQHRSPNLVFTAVLAFFCASFFFWPRDGARLVGWWNDFVGLGFATFFVQYLIRYLDLNARGKGASVAHVAAAIVVYLCSGLNNLLFLAAARILLNRNKNVHEDYTSGESLTLWVHFQRGLRTEFAEFRAALPRWAWFVAAIVAPLAIFDTRPSLIWVRFPDAIFSFYCIALFGYATAINFNVRRRKLLAGMALLICLGYGLAQLVYAGNSVVAYTAPPNKPTGFPLNWIRQKVGVKVNEIVLRSNARTHRDLNPKEFLDSAVYAVLLPMKCALFLPPFFLYLLFIISVNDFRRTLSETTSRRKDYLSADGIVRAIGKSLGANRVSLYIRIPGVKKTREGEVERVLPIIWHRRQNDSGQKLERSSPARLNPLQRHMMTHPESQDFAISLNGKFQPEHVSPMATESEAELTVPVKFHGGAIGFLEAHIVGFGRFNHTTLQKLKLFADLIAPSVQDFRSLAAADQIGSRLTLLQVKQTRLQVNHLVDYPQTVNDSVLDILHGVLSPLVTRLSVEMGFITTVGVRYVHDRLGKLLEEDIKFESGRGDETRTIELDGESYRLEYCPMTVRTGFSDYSRNLISRKQLGSLVLAIPSEKDDFARCTLAAYYLNRKTVASLTTDGILDLARNFYGSIIKDLGVEFSKEKLSREEWFAAIVKAIGKAGLIWVVAEPSSGSVASTDETIELLTIEDETRTVLLAQPLSWVSHAKNTSGKTVRLSLRKSLHFLYIGTRPGFGAELSFESPWKVFLDDLADVADTALLTLHEKVEEVDSAQSQALMMIAVTTGTLMHQLVNMITDQLYATETLEEILEDQNISLDAASKNLLNAMKRSGGQMRELTVAFKDVTKMEGVKPCSLKEAADQALKLFHIALMQRKIVTNIHVPADIQADLPFYVAAFAIANLIGNAKDAIKAVGRIDIEVEDGDVDGKFILCHVTNSGPKIAKDMQSRLFQLGATSKNGHVGWGLYFVSRSLQENGGAISFDATNPETRFTIRLPRSRPP